MSPISLIRAFGLLGLMFFIQGANAAPVNWGSNRLATNYTSDLQPLGSTQAFTFEIGTFRTGFAPTADNTELWAANWIAADSSSYNTDFAFAAGSASAAGEITDGDRAYIWGFDARESGAAEWILVSDPGWIWRSAEASTQPVDWTVGQAGEVVLGAVGGSGDLFHMQTAAIELGSDPSADPEAWRAEHFAGELDEPHAAWGADADADGLSNALEFAFNTSPRDANEVVRASAAIVTESGQNFVTFSYDREPNPAAPLTVQISEDLRNWTPAGQEVQLTAADGQLHLRDTQAISSGPRRFYRLSIDLD